MHNIWACRFANGKTLLITPYSPDSHSPQPPPPHLPTHNGRLRPRRPHPLLPPLRDLPPLQRKSALRIHLRPRPRRLPLTPHHILAHVARPVRLLAHHLLLPLSRPLTHVRRTHAGAPVEYVDVPAECECAGVLFVAACADEFCGGAVADGYGGGVCD